MSVKQCLFTTKFPSKCKVEKLLSCLVKLNAVEWTMKVQQMFALQQNQTNRETNKNKNKNEPMEWMKATTVAAAARKLTTAMNAIYITVYIVVMYSYVYLHVCMCIVIIVQTGNAYLYTSLNFHWKLSCGRKVFYSKCITNNSCFCIFQTLNGNCIGQQQ